MLAKLFIVLLLIDAFVLMAAILLQSGKGGGLAASFGGASAGDQLFGARQAGNLLTKVTWWGAGIFLGIAFIMQLMSARASGPTSVLDQSFGAPAKTAPVRTGDSAVAAPVSPLQALPPATAPSGGTTKKQP
jgi:preprotein translocase subunit SecG